MSDRQRQLEVENFRLRVVHRDQLWTYAFLGFIVGALCSLTILVALIVMSG